VGLEEICPEKIVSSLARIGGEYGGKSLVLLCWERHGEFCHRRLFAEWFRENISIEVPELAPGMIAKQSGTRQERLF
jgi:uncharacterized protein (DUF488 family)